MLSHCRFRRSFRVVYLVVLELCPFLRPQVVKELRHIGAVGDENLAVIAICEN